jgi:hypothetical protein
MDTEDKKGKRTIRERIWYPKEEDFISFKVFQMISAPVIMIVSVVLGIITKSWIWYYFILSWIVVSGALGIIASIRFKIIRPANKQRNS